MRSARGMKFIAIPALIVIFALVLTTLGFAQTFGQQPGVQGSQASGDLAKNRAPAKGAEPGSSFGVTPGVQGPQASGDLAKNRIPAKGPEPGSSFGVTVGVQGSQASGDLSTNALQRGNESK